MKEKRIKQYIVDAFTDRVFQGNPAAVCVLDTWIPEGQMMDIAGENNLSETAFTVKEAGNYRLRWFTPGGEIDLCGHATLATAFVLANYYEPDAGEFLFDTMSGRLKVVKRDGLYYMDFPAYDLKPVEVTDQMEKAMGARPKEAYLGRDLLCVFEDEADIRGMEPDMEQVEALDGLILQVTAPGREYDCVSRSFAPKLHVAEDPVCGSGHCHIIPYWADKLGKEEVTAYQASKRGGILYCRKAGDRVILAGKAARFSEADIYLPEE